MTPRSRLLPMAVVCIAACAAAPVQAQPAPAFDISVPSQPLGDALNVLARQTGMQLIVRPDLVAGRTAKPVAGRLTARQALDRVLDGSGLAASVEGGTVIVTATPAALSGGRVLAEVVVTGTGRDPINVSPPGYIALRGATATKTDTPLIEIPQSISVITRDQMEVQAIQTVEQSLRYTAGVLTEITGYDLRYASLNIRGFDATLYRDGLRLFKTGTYGDWLADPQGIERVEVLKGPTALLYGQGGPGGLVNQVSKRPVPEPVNDVGVAVGNHDRYQTNFDFGRAINQEGTLMFRINGLARDSNTQTAHSKDDRLFIAPALTWKPTDRTSITLLADHTRDRVTPKSWWPNQSLLIDYAQGRIPVETFAGEPGFDAYDRDMTSAGYLAEHRVDDTLVLRQNLRHARYDLDYQHVYATGIARDNRTATRASLISRANSDTTTVDTHLQKDLTTGPLQHRILVGLDYQDFSGTEDIGFGTAPSLDIFRPVYGRPFALPPTTRNTAELTQVGVYVQDQVKLGKWIVNAGVRRDRAETERGAGAATASAKDSRNSGSAGLLYRFDNGLAPYVSYATSFAPVVGTNYSSAPKPETARQTELGLKYQPPGSDSFLTASFFDMSKQNVTTLDAANPLLRTQTGEVRSRGLELEAKTRIGAGLDLIASYTWLDAWVSKSNDPAERGMRPFQTARNTAKLWVDYAFPQESLRGWGIGAGVRRVGPTVADTYNRYFNAGYTLVDAALHYNTGNLRFALNVANLTDKVTTANRAQFYGQDRTITASVGYRW